MRQHVYRVYDTRYQVPLYLWGIKHIPKMLRCFKISFPLFSGIFALYVFSNDSGFLNSLIFAQKRKFYQKRTSNQSWRLSNVTFWLKPNIWSKFHRKLLNLELFVIKILETLWGYTAQKKKFSITNLFSKCDQIRSLISTFMTS